MAQPPDDRRPMPWAEPADGAPEDPTVPWMAPDVPPPTTPGAGWSGFVVLSLAAVVGLIFLGGQISMISSDAGQSI